MANIVRSDAEIDLVINQCVDAEETGISKYPGMTYEEGVRGMWDWLIGDADESPLED
jgi:hypothetical protein